jgi:hypothetical protein
MDLRAWLAAAGSELSDPGTDIPIIETPRRVLALEELADIAGAQTIARRQRGDGDVSAEALFDVGLDGAHSRGTTDTSMASGFMSIGVRAARGTQISRKRDAVRSMRHAAEPEIRTALRAGTLASRPSCEYVAAPSTRTASPSEMAATPRPGAR